MDLIRAQTDLAVARDLPASNSGRTAGTAHPALREVLLGILAHVEAYIDFPDEDIDPTTGAALLWRIDSGARGSRAAVRTADQGQYPSRKGLRTVIFGEPNVGNRACSTSCSATSAPSSAISRHHPSDARRGDQSARHPGATYRYAGVRTSRDTSKKRESSGRGKCLSLCRTLPCGLLMRASPPIAPSAEVRNPPGVVLVLNKCDLGEDPGWEGRAERRFGFHARTGEGFEPLAEAISMRRCTARGARTITGSRSTRAIRPA